MPQDKEVVVWRRLSTITAQEYATYLFYICSCDEPADSLLLMEIEQSGAVLTKF